MINSKTLAWIGIPLLSAASLTIVNTVSQGYMFEGKKATAAYQAAMAELDKAKAEIQKAVAALAAASAAKLEAENKLLAAVEARRGQTDSAEIIGASTRDAAQITSKALVDAANVDKFAENAFFTKVAAPIIDPMSKVSGYNERIVRLQRELTSGIDEQTRRVLGDAERADRVAQKLILEEEVSILTETSSKNVKDNMRALTGGITQGFGQMAGLYPTGDEPVPVRRIVQER